MSDGGTRHLGLSLEYLEEISSFKRRILLSRKRISGNIYHSVGAGKVYV